MQKWILVFVLLFFPVAVFAAAPKFPTMVKCGGDIYNPKTQGCCGGDVFEKNTQACCGEQKIYTQGSQKCCPEGVVCQGNQRCLPPGEWSSDSQCEDDPNANDDSGALQVTPKTLVTEEDKEFLFKVKAVGKMTLVQVDEGGEKIRYRWEMMDNGLYGDEKAGDNIFSRMISIKERKAGKLYFTVEPNPSRIVSISVQPRPNFLQILSTVWNRINE
ncbi:MAG: hypothetical protein Q8P84_05650 [Deltaproteobacteria bacterium]|nr:hypothetical protein [Deltaproteobacteria bacterium]